MINTTVADLNDIIFAKGIGESRGDTVACLAIRNEEWLFVLNNADDPTFNLRNYFPRCSHGNILITSRNREVVRHTSDVRLSCNISGMHPNDAINLLLNISGLTGGRHQGNRRSGQNNCECTFHGWMTGQSIDSFYELGYLPLAVVQAGAYIFKSKCCLDRSLKWHRERRGGILDDKRQFFLHDMND